MPSDSFGSHASDSRRSDGRRGKATQVQSVESVAQSSSRKEVGTPDTWIYVPVAQQSGVPPMSKRELIDAILKHNRTAAPEFLARFAESELKAYLDRVCGIAQPTLRTSSTSTAKRELVAA